MLLEALASVSVLMSAIAVAVCLFIAIRGARSSAAIARLLDPRLGAIETTLGRAESSIREELSRGRQENSDSARSLREEIARLFETFSNSVRGSLTDLSNAQTMQLNGFGDKLLEARTEASKNAMDLRAEIQGLLAQLADALSAKFGELATVQSQRLDAATAQVKELTDGNERRQDALRTNIETKLGELKIDAAANAKALREELINSLNALSVGLAQTIEQISQSQKERLDRVSVSVTELTQKSGDQQELLRTTIEQRLDAIRVENADKLEQMRVTVDEKLQGTLEQRLGQSFKMVNDSLEQVYKSVGEMQALATGVGDLKKVLTNVKARGTWGEVALGNLLEQVMAPDQYERNVEVRPHSNQRVEFAIRLPGDGESHVWLPLDAKFPAEDYDRLLDATERGDVEGIESASKALEMRIRAAGKDISEKYIHPPYSTDFGVLFLPTEGLFAEIIRRPGLVDALQRECHITVAGPTTLASLLTALRMGFRSLAIQRQSSEVWKVLSAVKTEFGTFERVMDRVHKKLQEAQNAVEDVGVRRRAMGRKLRGVEAMPEIEAKALLELDAPGTLAIDGPEEAQSDAAE